MRSWISMTWAAALLTVVGGGAWGQSDVAPLPSTGASNVAPGTVNSLYNKDSGFNWSYTSGTLVNTSFRRGAWGWTVGHRARGYRFVWNRRAFFGKPCVELAAVGAKDGSWQCVVQNVSAVNYRGKRVRLSGWMKTANVDDVTFGLRLDTQSKVLSLASDQITGTTPWKKYTLTFDVPDDAQGFAIAPGNLGTRGRFWLADVRLDVVKGDASPAIATIREKESSVPSPTPKASSKPTRTSTFRYPGDTKRVVHIWMLARGGKMKEGLAEAESIAADPNASKEERCTALEGIAVLAMATGKTDDARKSLSDFDTQAKDLNIDPGVVTEAQHVREELDKQANMTPGPTPLPEPAPAPSASRTAVDATPEPAVASDPNRWRNANGNDWTNASTSPRNLSFAAGLEAWEKGADYSTAPDFVAKARRIYWPEPKGRKVAVKGRWGRRIMPIGVLASIVPRPHGNAVLCQWLRADNYLGKRVRITALMRMRGPRASRGSLFAHLDTKDAYTYWDGASSAQIAGPVWRRCTLVIDVPADGQGIIFGSSLFGKGTLSMADVRVEVVDSSVPLSTGGVKRALQ